MTSSNKIILIILLDILVIILLTIAFPWRDEWAIPSLQVAAFWCLITTIVALSGTKLPLGQAIASIGDSIDIAGIVVAGPLPIIVANMIILSITTFRESKTRIRRLPFNIVLWIMAPLAAALIYCSYRVDISDGINLNMLVAIIVSNIAYSVIQYGHVSYAISISESIPLFKVIKENYLYAEIASLVTIPITITMVLMWMNYKAKGVLLLLLPLLFVALGLRMAVERGKYEERKRREGQLTEFGKIAASILHEIEKPVSRIVMEAEYAINADDVEDYRNNLSQILKWAKDAGNITRDMFEGLAGILSATKFRLLNLIHSVIEELPSIDKERINLDIRVPEILTVMWDEEKIMLLVANLITNALEADQSKSVNILIRMEGNKGLFSKQSRNVIITVSDQGPGLPTGFVEQVFDPLFSTKEKGRGMGLFLCRQIAVAHGGTLRAEELIPNGVAFTLALPQHAII